MPRYFTVMAGVVAVGVWAGAALAAVSTLRPMLMHIVESPESDFAWGLLMLCIVLTSSTLMSFLCWHGVREMGR